MSSFLRHLRSLDHSALNQVSHSLSQSQSCRVKQANLGLRGAMGLLGSILIMHLAPGRALAGDLEFSAGSYPSPPNGPTTASQTANLLENTSGSTFVTYTPTTSVTASFSNQTYTNGLTFGATVTAGSKTPTARPVFAQMTAIGSPTNSMFTSTPNSPVGTGVSTTDNYIFSMFAATEPLFTANLPTNGRYYYGDVTLTFSRPVSNPVLQIVGLGGTAGTHGHTSEFELVNTGITASKLSGTNELNVTGNKILNSATTIGATCGSGAACGSVLFTGTNITTLTFKVYVRGDNGAGTWSTSTGYSGDQFLFGAVSIAKPITVSGTVFKDANGLTDSSINGTGSNAGGLFANLLDSTGKVVTSTAIAANGTYSFLAIGAGNYTVSLSTTAGVQGTAAPAPNLPTNWANTGEGTTAAGDGTVNGSTAITVAAVDVTGVNFGIDQLPSTTGLTPAAQPNPGGTATVQVPTLAGTDPEDGVLGSGKSFQIVTLPVNGTLTYNGSPVTAGQVIANYNPTLLKLDPNDGAVTVSFTYAAVDAAAKVDPTPANVAIPFSASFITVSGTVFSDADGSVTINGSDAGTNAGSANLTLYVVDSAGKVVDKATVAANGTYSLTNVPASSNLTLLLSNDTTVAIGATAPTTASLPSNWVNTGENKNGTTETITPGDIAITTTTVNLPNENFGIEQLPNTTDLTPASQTNPGGTATVPVPTLAGTDPEDGALGSGKSFKIVTLPTNGTLTYNGSAVTAGQVIASYDPTLLKLDPNDGAITVSFTYAAVDAAGQTDPTPATVTMPFTTAANVLLVKRITAINGDRTKNSNDNTTLNAFVDDTTSTKAADDNNSNWLPNYLKGAINAGKVKPGDDIEYTIYFLNAGSVNANTVRICDRLRPNQAFQPDGYGTGTGVQLQLGTSAVINLTNANDASDRTQFIAAGGTVPTNCNITGTNTDGTIVIDVTGAAATGNPTLTTMPGSTAAGSPNDSYGFFRFITKVNP